MGVIWFGVGFMVGMVLWMPFIIDARMDVRLARIALPHSQLHR
jgi:hypothetical protein